MTHPADPSPAHDVGVPPTPARDIATLVAALFPALEPLPRVPQQQRSREKRDELLQAAARIFAARGYAMTTADDIAGAAGVSVGTFYNYFRHKRQIFLTLVLERLEGIFGNLRLAQMDLSHGVDRAVIRAAVVSALSDNAETGLRHVWAELLSLEPDLIPYQRMIRRYAVSQLEERLRQAVQSGRARADLDVAATAFCAFSLLDALSLRREEAISDARLIDAATEMIFRAMAAPTPAESRD